MTQDAEEKKQISELALEQDSVLGDTTIGLFSQQPVVLEPGQIILEKFRIIELLGRGGMGSVYRVEHLLVNRVYALKCLSKSQTDDASWRRFQNEAKAAHMLDHANLIRVYEFGLLPGGQPFFLMELVNGSTLADEIKKSGSLELQRALKIFIHVAFAIQYAHQHRVVHRDLKPSNIMLSKSQYEHEPELVKVVDFGIAKLTGQDEFNQQTLTKTGEIFGSPLYMSPEQCMGIAVDHRSDLYSLGCVFYETLTGAPPFIGDSALSTMLKHQSDNQLSLREASLGLQFPLEIERIIGKLLQKDPDNRYQSARALAEDLIELEKILSGEQPPGAKSSLAIATQKLELTMKKQPGSQNIYMMLAVCISAFVAGIILCYLVLSGPSKMPISTPTSRSMEFTKEEREAAAIESEATNSHLTRPWSTRNGKYRDFKFPEDESLGLIEFKDGTHVLAKGRVKVPLTEPIGLTASDYLVRNPDLLDGFQPDELSVLDLAGTKKVRPEIFSHLKRLTGLKVLNVSGTDFGDSELDDLASLTELKYLNLATSNVSCKSVLRSPLLKNLECLDVTCTNDGNLLAAKVYSLPNLKQLIMGSSLVTDKDMKNLARSKSIKVLCLAECYVTERGIADLVALRSLEWIDLSSTAVKPEVCKYLAQMPALKTVEMGHAFSAASREKFIAYLREHKPQTSILWTNTNTGDLAACMPDFPWQGGGVVPHIDLARVFVPARN